MFLVTFASLTQRRSNNNPRAVHKLSNGARCSIRESIAEHIYGACRFSKLRYVILDTGGILLQAQAHQATQSPRRVPGRPPHACLSNSPCSSTRHQNSQQPVISFKSFSQYSCFPPHPSQHALLIRLSTLVDPSIRPPPISKASRHQLVGSLST